MQNAALKREAKKAIDALSEEKVKVAIDFIDYLKEKEEMEATLEILSSRELMAQIEEAEKAIKKGTLEEFVPWKKVQPLSPVVYLVSPCNGMNGPDVFNFFFVNLLSLP
jgi:hypothetical protein